jgi:hypothetical protein
MMVEIQSMNKNMTTLVNRLSRLYVKTRSVLKRVEGVVSKPSIYNECDKNSDETTYSVTDTFLKLVRTSGNKQEYTKIEVIELLHSYICQHKLHIDTITRDITCDEALTTIFKLKTIPYFELSSLVDTHIIQ